MKRLRRPVPDAVREVRGRRLGWGLADDGTALVATDEALHLGADVLAWAQIERVSWQPPRLTVLQVSEVEGTGCRRSFVLTEDEHLAEVVRARVTSSVGWSDRRRLSPAGHVRLVGRRLPGRDELLWQAVFADAADAADDDKREQARQLVEELRRTIG